MFWIIAGLIIAFIVYIIFYWHIWLIYYTTLYLIYQAYYYLKNRFFKSKIIKKFYNKTIDMDNIDDLDNLEPIEDKIVEKKYELTINDKKKKLREKRLQQRNNRAVGNNRKNMTELKNLLDSKDIDPDQLKKTADNLLASLTGGNTNKLLSSVPKGMLNTKNINKIINKI
jgi:biopolymer transport protein ExbB/TolQ